LKSSRGEREKERSRTKIFREKYGQRPRQHNRKTCRCKKGVPLKKGKSLGTYLYSERKNTLEGVGAKGEKGGATDAGNPSPHRVGQ